MLKGFKDFIMRGNVVDLAVGIVIGAAFTAVVGGFTKAFLEPLIRLISGGTGARAGDRPRSRRRRLRLRRCSSTRSSPSS